MHGSLASTGLTRRNTLFTFVWLRHRNNRITVHHPIVASLAGVWLDDAQTAEITNGTTFAQARGREKLLQRTRDHHASFVLYAFRGQLA